MRRNHHEAGGGPVQRQALQNPRGDGPTRREKVVNMFTAGGSKPFLRDLQPEIADALPKSSFPGMIKIEIRLEKS